MYKSEGWSFFTNFHESTFKKLFESVLRNVKQKRSLNSINRQNTICIKDPRNNIAINETIRTDFGNLLKTSKFSDFELLVDGQSLKAHKSILSCKFFCLQGGDYNILVYFFIGRSKVFESMLNHHDTREVRENCMKIEGLDYQTVKEMLNYMYTGDITNLASNSVNLFLAADRVNFQYFLLVGKYFLIKYCFLVRSTRAERFK